MRDVQLNPQLIFRTHPVRPPDLCLTDELEHCWPKQLPSILLTLRQGLQLIPHGKLSDSNIHDEQYCVQVLTDIAFGQDLPDQNKFGLNDLWPFIVFYNIWALQALQRVIIISRRVRHIFTMNINGGSGGGGGGIPKSNILIFFFSS